MMLLPAYFHGSFPLESHTKLLSSYPHWVTPFAQTRLVVWSSQKNKRREGGRLDFMNFWKIYWSSSPTVRKICQGRNISCTPWHGTATMGMTWQDQISCWGNTRCSSPCPQLTVVTQRDSLSFSLVRSYLSSTKQAGTLTFSIRDDAHSLHLEVINWHRVIWWE